MRKTEEKGRIMTGVIGAMEEEVASLKEAMTEKETVVLAGMEFCRGLLDDRDAVVVRCGIGKVNAAVCCSLLIHEFGADRIINTGSAGSLDARIDIGDIVVSTDAVQHDFDLTPLGEGFKDMPGTGAVPYRADEAMRKSAAEAVRETAPEVRVFEGRICSGDQFIASRERKEAIIAAFGGLCCEMEGAAIAQVCGIYGTPFVILRAISDKADDSEEMSYLEFEREASARCAAITRRMLSR